MNSRLFPAVLGAGLCCATLVHAGALGPKPDDVHKILHAKIDVGPDGSVSAAAMAEKKVPPAIEQAILTRVKSWHFAPVLADGKAVAATTYAAFLTCATKSGDGYDLAVKYLDNGPLLTKNERFEFQPVVSQFSKEDQTITVKMTVLPNGRAQLQDVVLVDVDPRIDRDIRLSVKHWVDDMRYTPETVGGQPVATAMEMPVWIWSDTGLSTKAAKPDLYPPPAPCDAAKASRNIPHPVDDQFKPNEGGAPVATPPAN